MVMLVLFISLVYSLQTTYLCTESTDLQREENGDHYCYKIFRGYLSHRGNEEYCQNEYFKDAHMISFHSNGEWQQVLTWARDEMGGSYGSIYVGLTTTSWWPQYENYNRWRDWDDFELGSPYGPTFAYTDGSDTSWLSNNRIVATPSTGTCMRIDLSENYWDPQFDIGGCWVTNYLNGCKFKIPECDGHLASSTSVCSGKGYCLEEELCTCFDFDYYGQYCEKTHSCGGVRQDDPSVCSGRGNCTSQDICVCEEGFKGDTCSETWSNGCDDGIQHDEGCYVNYGSGLTFEEAEAKCVNDFSGHLVSIEGTLEESFVRDTLRTSDAWLGLKKNSDSSSLHPCPPSDGYTWTDDTADTVYASLKRNSIDCDSDDLCIAFPSGYLWEDVPCNSTEFETICKRTFYRCRGILGSEEDVCRRRGQCVDNNQCECFNGYYGDDCQSWSCFGYAYNYFSYFDAVCSGNGDCLAPDYCECNEGFGGINCNITTCYTIYSDDEEVCSGHGTCAGPDDCYCDDDYYGDECEYRRPYPASDDSDVWCYSDGGTYPTCIWYFGEYDHVGGEDEHTGPNIKNYFEAEEYCNTEFYPLLGHLYSIHNDYEYEWMLTLSHLFEFQTGLRKTTSCSCNDGEGIMNSGDCDWNTATEEPKYVWTDGTSVDYIANTRNWEATGQYNCNDRTANCMRACTFRNQTINPSLHYDVQLTDFDCGVKVGYLCTYRLHYCQGIREDDNTVCNGNGFCWDWDKCSCKKGAGYFGDDCHTNECFNIQSDDSSVCSGHGSCEEDDVCTCEEGYYGDECEVTSCGGILTNETNRGWCSFHGDCVLYDQCICDSTNYFGENCEKSFCNYISADDDDACNGHGECTSYNTCSCNFTLGNYWGTFCEKYECFGHTSTSPKVCSGFGECLDEDECSCFDNYYGFDCNITSCEGVFNNDTSQEICSGRGTCWPYETCTCDEGYWGFGNCDHTSCNGILSTKTGEVCSGKGSCNLYDQCTCDAGYYGEWCEVTTCGGIFSNDSNVCGGAIGETCWPENDCHCQEHYSGTNCSVTTCNGVLNTDTSNVCSGRGRCSAYDVCDCDDDDQWDGEYWCNVFKCYGVSAMDSKVCNGKGSCSAYDTCACTEGTEYFGKHCYEHVGTEFEYSLSFRREVYLGTRKLSTVYEVPESHLTQTMNEWFDCSAIFTSYNMNGTVGNFFGEPQCRFVGSDGQTSKLEFVISPTAPLLKGSGIVYHFSLVLQDSNNNETITLSLALESDELGEVKIDDHEDDGNENLFTLIGASVGGSTLVLLVICFILLCCASICIGCVLLGWKIVKPKEKEMSLDELLSEEKKKREKMREMNKEKMKNFLEEKNMM